MTAAMENTGTFMLSKEIELLMAERARLLRVAGAAAQFVAVMESSSLPERVATEAEILAGSPKRRIAEFARGREARLVVVGSRRRKLGPSVSTAVVRKAGAPVVVARDPERLADMVTTKRSRAWERLAQHS